MSLRPARRGRAKTIKTLTLEATLFGFRVSDTPANCPTARRRVPDSARDWDRARIIAIFVKIDRRAIIIISESESNLAAIVIIRLRSYSDAVTLDYYFY